MFKKINKKILYTLLFILFFGFMVFFSASLSSLKNPEFFSLIFTKQLIAISIGLVLLFFIATSRKIKSVYFKKYSLWIISFGLLFQLLVFIPGIALKLKGASRWIDLGFISLQPSEVFKYTLIIFISVLLVAMDNKLKDFKIFSIFFISTFFILGVIFYLISDFGTLITIYSAIFSILLISKAKIRFLLGYITVLAAILLPLLYFFVPYVTDRLDVYLFPESIDIQNEGYHINQTKITIGSGELTGRGFGLSLQKYTGSLPEPLGDSIFAVYSEEFGFIGSVSFILVFLLLLLFILDATHRIRDKFEQMIVLGFTVLIFLPIFYNIASTLGVFPVSGIPITFVSKGGSAMVMGLIAMGIILLLTRKDMVKNARPYRTQKKND